MNEKQKEIMDMVKAGINQHDYIFLEIAFINSIRENENKILKNILEKTFLNQEYLENNPDTYIEAIKASVSYSNTKALEILPKLELDLEEKYYYGIEEVYNQVVADDDVNTFNALLEHESFHVPRLQSIAVEYSSQKMIDRLISYEGVDFDHELSIREVIDSKNLETISKYLTNDVSAFLERVADAHEINEVIGNRFVNINENLFNSKIFNDIAIENGLKPKEVEKEVRDFCKEHLPEEYKRFNVKQNVMNF